MVAPLDPTTASLTVALNLSPGWLVLVHTLSLDVRLMVVPAGTVPNATSLPAGVVATLLPDAVVVLSGAAADGVEDDGARWRGRVRSGAFDEVGAGAAVFDESAGGTSFSCGCGGWPCWRAASRG